MLKMGASGLIILGLSHVNLARLKDGRPIAFDGAEIGIPGTQIVIFAGETEQSMVSQMQEFIGPHTKVQFKT
jgi:hypothetical protein